MIYLLEYGDKANRIPFRVVKVYEHHILLESMRYPSEYGMSKSFRMCAHKLDLIGHGLTWKGFIHWVEGRPLFSDYVFSAHKGYKNSINVLKEWDRVKRHEKILS